MRSARILILAAAAAIAIALAVVALLPAMLDWNRYRGTFELLAADALGRPVTIAGPISLSLLPQPVLTASRVRVGGGGDGARILVAELRLRVALVPLLSGQVDARELTLQGPDLRLPWPPRLGLPFATPPWLAALSARIENGRIEAGNLTLTHVDATLTAGRGDAALVLAGSAAVGASTWQIALRLNEPEADGNAALDASLTGAGAVGDIAAKLTGRLEPSGRMRGHVVLDGPDLSRLLTAPALPFHADGKFSVAAGKANLSELAITLGGVTASGGGRLVLTPSPRLDLALSSDGAVPLDPWLAVLRQGGANRLPIGLSLSAPRATLARGLLQHLRLALVLGPEGARIGAFQAILPGEARLDAEGRIDHAAGKEADWQFTGTAHLAAPALATTLHWLDAALPHVLPRLPPDVLRQADIGGRVTIAGTGIALDNLSGTVDRSRVSGSLSLGLGGKPAISAGLTLDQLDLDPWMPEAVRRWPPSLAAMPKLFTGISAELRLAVEHAHLGRTEISGLSLDAAAGPDQVILRRLDATFDGVHSIASGTLGAGGAVTAGRLALTAAGPEALARLLPAPFGPALARWRAAFSLEATAAGAPQQLHLTLDAALGDLRLTATPVLDLRTGAWQGPITLRHPGAAEMIAASGLLNPAGWLGEGSFSLIGRTKGSPGGWALDDFRLIAGSLSATGSLNLATGPAGPEIQGTINAPTLPVPLPTPGDAEPLPFDLLAGWQGAIHFSAGKVLAGPRAVLSAAKGSMRVADRMLTVDVNASAPGGGAVAAVLHLDAKAAPPTARLGAAFANVRLKGGLFGTPFDLVAGTLSGKLALTGDGYSPAGVLATLGGTAQLEARGGAITGISLGGVRRALAPAPVAVGTSHDAAVPLAAALSAGRTEFTRLTLAADGTTGRFTLHQAQLEAADGTMAATGTVDVPARGEDLRVTLTPALIGAPEMVVRLAGLAQRPKRLIEASAALHWLAERNQAR